MAARRLREPVPQMRQTLQVSCPTAPLYIAKLELRVHRIEGLMLERGMKPADAKRRLSRALNLADGPDWTFGCAWEIGWQTIYWPHNTGERHFEQDCLRLARGEFELAWHGRQTKLEGLRALMDAVEEARADEEHALRGELVA